MLLQLKLKDYTGEPINPTNISLKVQVSGVEYEITNTSTTHVIGYAEGGSIQGTFQIVNNELRIRTQNSTSQAIVQSINEWELVSLQTEEKEYTSFYFIH